jgi:hypothetical protein
MAFPVDKRIAVVIIFFARRPWKKEKKKRKQPFTFFHLFPVQPRSVGARVGEESVERKKKSIEDEGTRKKKKKKKSLCSDICESPSRVIVQCLELTRLSGIRYLESRLCPRPRTISSSFFFGYFRVTEEREKENKPDCAGAHLQLKHGKGRLSRVYRNQPTPHFCCSVLFVRFCVVCFFFLVEFELPQLENSSGIVWLLLFSEPLGKELRGCLPQGDGESIGKLKARRNDGLGLWFSGEGQCISFSLDVINQKFGAHFTLQNRRVAIVQCAAGN